MDSPDSPPHRQPGTAKSRTGLPPWYMFQKKDTVPFAGFVIFSFSQILSMGRADVSHLFAAMFHANKIAEEKRAQHNLRQVHHNVQHPVSFCCFHFFCLLFLFFLYRKSRLLAGISAFPSIRSMPDFWAEVPFFRIFL